MLTGLRSFSGLSSFGSSRRAEDMRVRLRAAASVGVLTNANASVGVSGVAGVGVERQLNFSAGAVAVSQVAAVNVTPASGAFTPADLSPSVWYDPSDLSTLFQERTGASATTAASVGDPVGTVLDKSGNDYHATAPSDAARPTLQQTVGGEYFLDFDGTDDSMSTASTVDLSSTDKVTIFAGMRRDTTSVYIFYELSDFATSASQTGTFYKACNFGGREQEAYARGDAANNRQYAEYQTATTPNLTVATDVHDISGDSSIIRINGTQEDENTLEKGAGNFRNDTLYIGAQNNSSFYFNGRLYGLIIMPALATAQQLSDAESWMADKSGVTLP